MRLLAAPDKFRGTLDATQAAQLIAAVGRTHGWETIERPLSDGGEGFADVLGGERVTVRVEGPLGAPVTASYRRQLDHPVAVMEMASAAGRALLPSPTGSAPLDASTRGVGQLIVAAIDGGATRVVVGCGGSATTDGGIGAVDAIAESGRSLEGIELVAATDVTTSFLDAARVFGPQKGATPTQIIALSERLERCRALYLDRFGLDVGDRERGGAAGGLAGGLAALGARLVSGFDVVAAAGNLGHALTQSDLVVTGEGSLDATSLEGKVIASLLAMTPASMPVLVVAGSIGHGVVDQLEERYRRSVSAVSLTERAGPDRSLHDTAAVLTEVLAAVLATR